MVYTTTKLLQLKSYSTYQFHCLIKSGTLSAEDIFKIGILETFRWLRGRLSNYESLPDAIMLPEPEQYDKLSMDKLHSFISNAGIVIDVVYVEKKGLWSFCLTEPDGGANIGQESERKAVNGRTFSTEICFVLGEKAVEAGFRIVCSEPADCNEPCEGFRPALVKALADNEKLYFEYEDLRLEGKPIVIDSKASLESLKRMSANPAFDLPIVYVAEGAIVEEEKKEIDIGDVISSVNTSPFGFMSMLTGGGASSLTRPMGINISEDKLKTKAPLKKDLKEAASAKKEEATQKAVKEIKRCRTVDYSGIARSLITQAVVVYVEEKFLAGLKDSLGISLKEGAVKVTRKGRVLYSYRYEDYKEDIHKFERRLKEEVRGVSKHQSYFFGNIGRHSDAKIIEVQSRRNTTGEYLGEIESLKEENKLLQEKIDELERQESDRSSLMDELQQTKKDLRNKKKENDKLIEEKDSLTGELNRANDKVESAGKLVAFMRDRWELAVLFPAEKDKICDWIGKNFSDTLYVARKAENSLKKYGGRLNMSDFCDAIIYLHAYSKYRKDIIAEEELSLYAAINGWEAEPCGKEALKICKDDYTVSYEGKSELLNLHLKSGVKSGELIRIYFLWDEELQKIVIGYMPDHLPTRKKGT